MGLVLLFLFLGGGIGFLLRHLKSISRVSDYLTHWSIYAFLFILGISVGSKKEIINNIGTLCYQACAIAFAAVSGSVILAYYVYKYFFKESE